MNEGNLKAEAAPGQHSGPSSARAGRTDVPEDFALAQHYWDALGQSWTKCADEWQRWASAAFVHPHTPAPDRRFAGPEWQTPYFALLRDQYLAACQYWEAAVDSVDLPRSEKERLRFAVRQWLDAMAPTNFPATNPEAIKLALATDGESLRKGAENLARDFSRGRLTMTDESAFEVGRNLALTPGAVVYRNPLIELIQYDATTPKVHARPLLIVPPCINKFYILDLQPENSLIRHAVGEGHSVFVISWRNIPAELGGLTWDDYLEQGVLQALRIVREISGAAQANVLGFCVGGALLACALAILAARGDRSVASSTFLATMLDYENPGQIGVYVDEASLASRSPRLLAGERVNGAELAGAFASLRANELVWSFVVNNYLKGRTPPAFDLLYWNGDSTNL
ncbi:MAG: alpha/beta fold hydrolase, partial [Betaproteobacteria bacterium]